MLLVLIRHGKAFDRDPVQWPDDHRRPLTKAGRREMERVGQALRGLGIRIDQVYSSPLVRAWQTAEALREGDPNLPEPREADWLGESFGNEEALRTLQSASQESTVGFVGHEPDFSQFAALLIGAPFGSVEVKKGSLVGVRFDRVAAPGSGILEFLFPPKRLVEALKQ